MVSSEQNRRAAIIGGGPAGLATARALRVAGIPFVIFERHSDFGGIWDAQNPGTPMYRSAHFISSRTMSGHLGYPMPNDYPDYPSHRQILDYARSFASAFNLYETARFGTNVVSVRKSGERWDVTTLRDGIELTEVFDWVICASGTNWSPNTPDLPGQETFSGKILHAVSYAEPSILEGRRVLVVGAGNSGVDIACDAAFAADKAFISLRRGYHFVPKHILGRPADVFANSSRWMPMWLTQRTFGLLLKMLNGDLRLLGLPKPDHRVLESHPIMNSQLLHYLQHGDVKAKPDIERLDGKSVVFKDGSREEIDLVILATGYNWRIDYLPAGSFDWRSSRPKAFLKMFNPRTPSLFLNGFIETNSGAYKLFDEMGMLIAQAILAQRAGGNPAEAFMAFINGKEPDLGGGVSYVKSDRHFGYTNIDAYQRAMKRMRNQLGWPDPIGWFSNLKPSKNSDKRIERAAA
jgi:hypothetical protein